MKIMFMGTPDFALNSLKRLIDDNHEVTAVVTQPDKPKGRGFKLTPPPVKVLAAEHNIDVYQPGSLKNGELKEILERHNPDLIVVVAYGKILPQYVLEYPKYGCINVHASLLPKYRGAAPINWAIINGEAETGVTTMYMEKGLDTGDMLLKKSVKIDEIDNFGTLHDKLSIIGADVLSDTLKQLENGSLKRIKQNDDESSYASMLDKNIAKIDFNKNAKEIINLVRGLNPFPCAFTVFGGKILKVYSCEIYHINTDGYKNGEIIKADCNDGIIVKCNDSALKLNDILMEGTKRMSSADYLKGHKIDGIFG